MSNKFIINRGLENIIKEKNYQSGAIWITEDGQNLYMDSKDGKKRIQITDVIDISINDPEKYYPNKLYICDRQLKRYNSKTGKLDIISDLDNEAIISQNIFNYNSEDLTIATIEDNSKPRKGTVVLDKIGSVGIVTSCTDKMLDVTIISNNTFKNTLNGYDIYFDSNYNGQQFGTFECPFNSWDTLYTKHRGLLHGYDPVVIHIKTNSYLEIKSDNFKNLYRVTFTSNDCFSSMKFLEYNQEAISDNEDLIFENINMSYTQGVTDVVIPFSKCKNLTFRNVKFSIGFNLMECSNVTVTNSTNIQEIWLTNKTSNTTLNNIMGDTKIHCDMIEGITTVLNGYIYSLEASRSINGDIELINTIIKDSISVTNYEENSIQYRGCNSFSFNSCVMLKQLPRSKCVIDANNIDLGIVTFNGITPKLTGTVNILSGLLSEQVYDTNELRAYGKPENNTLRAHLDKISEAINDIQEKLK